jgi:excinuclease ABC subunit A
MDAIILHGIKTHNLKNIDLIIPHHKFYAVTGVSGSGKSSLAFDTLYAEGQRRFVESLSAYARQFLERMEKPDVESASGIPPAIAIEAKNVITNARSTVGTQTEINDYLRVLFSRIGRTLCPKCNLEVRKNSPEDIANILMARYSGQKATILFDLVLGEKGAKYLKNFLPEFERQGFTDFYLNGKQLSSSELLKAGKITGRPAVCVDQLKLEARHHRRLVESLESAFRYGRGECRVAFEANHEGVSNGNRTLSFSEAMRCFSCGMSFREPVPNLFSFNSPLGACPECQGFGRVITLDWDLVVPDKKRSIRDGAIEPWTKPSAAWEAKQLLTLCRRKNIPIDKPWQKLSETQKNWILRGTGNADDDYFSVRDFFDYLEKKTYKMHVRIFLSKYRKFVPCHVCHETRLKPEALYVQVLGHTICDFQNLSLGEFSKLLDTMVLSEAEKQKVEPVYLEIKRRTRFLNEVGLSYLSLSRLSRTLSGGEVQRIHLATSLGSALVDTLYVLDEPSIGLHERDNQLLIRLLRELRDLGNTVVVVEHDRTMIEAADEIIDLGPGGGREGGRILFQGRIEGLKRMKQSLTGQYLSGDRSVERHAKPTERMEGAGRSIEIYGAAEHNLKNIDVRIPLRQLVVISGVSGSGKSTLLYDILYYHYLAFRGRPVQGLGKLRSIRGYENIDEMVVVDQSPIGRTPRSNPVTYLKAFDDIRKIFARTERAKREGLEAGHFSFNVDGGRCDVCKGDGRIKVEMHFLADVYVPCEACHGKRFKPGVLEILYKAKNIDEVLAMTVDEGCRFFEEHPVLYGKLDLLRLVGLGYLCLGQPATTLSGGEAQRLKLAYEMTEKKGQHILYLFDEPTTGLHYHEIHYLMGALDELLEQGHSVVMIEHNMEVIRSADHLIDLGPEGGEEGGRVLYGGPLQGIYQVPGSYTGQYLNHYQKSHPAAK